MSYVCKCGVYPDDKGNAFSWMIDHKSYDVLIAALKSWSTECECNCRACEKLSSLTAESYEKPS